MNQLMQDVRYAMRQLRKSPGFTMTAVLTLALGIGANTAIFTLVHSLLLRNLPVADPKTLFRVGDTDDCCVNGGLMRNDDYSILFLGVVQASAGECAGIRAACGDAILPVERDGDE